MGSSMDLQGFEKMQKRILELGKKGQRAENEALKAGGEVLSVAMADNVNRSDVRDWHIQDNIIVSRVRNNDFNEKYVEVGVIKKLAWRAKFLEFGTEKMSPRPFMEPAHDDAKNSMNRAMADILSRRLGL